MSPAIAYILVGFLAGVFGGSWKPFLGFHKAPPTKEVTQLQAQVTVAQQAAEKAEKDKDAAVAAERAGLSAQVRSAQVDNAGTVEALKKAPPSPEVALASRMALRVDLKLATAIGKLPEADQLAMVELIEQALSGKQAEVDAANAKLAKADADFKAITAQRDAIAAEIPKLQQKAVEAAKQAENAQIAYNGKVNEVNEWAAKKDEADKRAGSFLGSFEKLRNWAIGIVSVWAFLVFVVPGIVKHLDAGWLKTGLRHVAGYVTSPLLYLDATKKIPNTNLLKT